MFAVKFNLMDVKEDCIYKNEKGEELQGLAKVVFVSETFIGNYELAPRKIEVRYSNKRDE